jgi:hypothetical protein
MSDAQTPCSGSAQTRAWGSTQVIESVESVLNLLSFYQFESYLLTHK